MSGAPVHPDEAGVHRMLHLRRWGVLSTPDKGSYDELYFQQLVLKKGNWNSLQRVQDMWE